MIIYRKLWDLLKAKGISQYKLINIYGFDSAQIHRLRKNKNIETATLNRLCKVLDCQPGDITEYIPDEDDCDENIE